MPEIITTVSQHKAAYSSILLIRKEVVFERFLPVFVACLYSERFLRIVSAARATNANIHTVVKQPRTICSKVFKDSVPVPVPIPINRVVSAVPGYAICSRNVDSNGVIIQISWSE